MSITPRLLFEDTQIWRHDIGVSHKSDFFSILQAQTDLSDSDFPGSLKLVLIFETQIFPIFVEVHDGLKINYRIIFPMFFSTTSFH